MSGLPLRLWWIAASALLVCIGSFGPWAKVLFVSAGGLDGDGWITLVAGLAALALLAVYARAASRPRPAWPLLVVLVAGAIATAVGLYDWVNIETAIDDELFSDAVSVGWGLVLVTFAGASLVLAAAVTLARRSAESSPVPTA